MDERRLEGVLRAGLQEHAAEADVTAPVVRRAREAAGRRRRTRWVSVAAAAAVAVVVTGVAVAGRAGDDPGSGVDTPAADHHAGLPAQWRTEYWGDVAVDVPASWGYGGAPDESGTACYPEAMLGPDGERLDGGNGLGYVGRPIAGTDVCALVPKAWEPDAPYVWLGAAVEPGTLDYGNGYVQETVEVNGSTVTVGTDEPALRRRILDTVRGGETCLSELETSGDIGHDAAANGADPVALRVCAYRGSGARSARLVYATRLGDSALARYQAALDAGEEPRDQCPTADYVEGEWVVLELVDADGGTVRSDVVHLACPGIDVGAETLTGLETTRLTDAMTAPWSQNGVRAVLSYFIGPQG